MKVKLLLIFMVIALSALIVFNFDYATSVIPGWHTTILPPFFIAGLFFCWSLLIAVVYFLFFRKSFTRNNIVFYLSMTLPCLLLIEFFKYAEGLEGERKMSIFILMPVFIICLIAYVVAQVWVVVKMGRIGFRRMRE